MMIEPTYTLDQIRRAFFEVLTGTGDYGFYAAEWWDEFTEERWNTMAALLESLQETDECL